MFLEVKLLKEESLSVLTEPSWRSPRDVSASLISGGFIVSVDFIKKEVGGAVSTALTPCQAEGGELDTEEVFKSGV